MSVKYSLIIPVKEINDYVRETVPHILEIKRSDWELIIIPNETERNEWGDERIRVIPSGRVGPAKKRDQGSELAKGDILVFIDDDSYPKVDFLDQAEKYFEDEQIVALGGPAVTPPRDSFWQKVSGAFYLSKMSGGIPERYIPIGSAKEIYDWPSVNLMVRRDAFLKIGGFNSPYWPGEDTMLCLDLVNKTQKKIMYAPEVVVWHHRREGLLHHLKQVGGYALHRGYFAKKFPKTSRKFIYFVPSVFVIFTLVSLPVLLLLPRYSFIIYLGWGCYILALMKAYIDILRYETMIVGIAAIGYTIPSHLWYGVRFLQGLLTLNLVSRLR